MDPIEDAILDAARPVHVTRSAEGTRTGGRFTPGAQFVAVVALAVQPNRPSSLARLIHGDSSNGSVLIFAAGSALAAAYELGDADKVPLEWTTLNIAPAKGAEGPRGDYVTWNGRRYEITEQAVWDDAGLIPDSNFRRYVAEGLGSA